MHIYCKRLWNLPCFQEKTFRCILFLKYLQICIWWDASYSPSCAALETLPHICWNNDSHRRNRVGVLTYELLRGSFACVCWGHDNFPVLSYRDMKYQVQCSWLKSSSQHKPCHIRPWAGKIKTFERQESNLLWRAQRFPVHWEYRDTRQLFLQFSSHKSSTISVYLWLLFGLLGLLTRELIDWSLTSESNHGDERRRREGLRTSLPIRG